MQRQPSKKHDGRVHDVKICRESAVDYSLSPLTEPLEQSRDLRGLESTALMSLFFSKENIDALQEGIRWRVHVESNGQYTISRQSETELRIIMRSIYLQESKNDPHSIMSQVKDLNARVLAFCVPRIISEVSIYLKYQSDVSKLPVPFSRGELATSKGSKVLEMKMF